MCTVLGCFSARANYRARTGVIRSRSLSSSSSSSISEDNAAIHKSERVRSIFESREIGQTVDPRFQATSNYDTSSAWKAIETAMACVSSNAVDRLDMGDWLNYPGHWYHILEQTETTTYYFHTSVVDEFIQLVKWVTAVELREVIMLQLNKVIYSYNKWVYYHFLLEQIVVYSFC